MRSRYLQQHDGANQAIHWQQSATFKTNTVFKETSTHQRHTLNQPHQRTMQHNEITSNNQPTPWTKVNHNLQDLTIFQATHWEGVLKNEEITSNALHPGLPIYSQVKSHGTQSKSLNSSIYSEPPLQQASSTSISPCSQAEPSCTDRYWLLTAKDSQYLVDCSS
jgi:hypothetical protein